MIYCCPVNNSFPLYWFVYQRFIVIFTKGACLYTIRAESPTSHSPGQRPGYNGVYNEQCALQGQHLNN